MQKKKKQKTQWIRYQFKKHQPPVIMSLCLKTLGITTVQTTYSDHVTNKDQMETALQGYTCLLAQHSHCVRASPDTDSLDEKPVPDSVGHV